MQIFILDPANDNSAYLRRDKCGISGEIRCTTEECEIFANKGVN